MVKREDKIEKFLKGNKNNKEEGFIHIQIVKVIVKNKIELKRMKREK